MTFGFKKKYLPLSDIGRKNSVYLLKIAIATVSCVTFYQYMQCSTENCDMI